MGQIKYPRDYQIYPCFNLPIPLYLPFSSLSYCTFLLQVSLNAQITSVQKISELQGNLPRETLRSESFGASITLMSDLDNDGTRDLIVGSPDSRNETFSRGRGSIWILYMKTRRPGKKEKKRYSSPQKFRLQSNLGFSVAVLSDLDQDGIPEIAVGRP